MLIFRFSSAVLFGNFADRKGEGCGIMGADRTGTRVAFGEGSRPCIDWERHIRGRIKWDS